MVKERVKRLLRTTCATLAVILGATLGAPATATTVEAAGNCTANTNKTYQEIKGYGGMNFPVWGVDLTDAQAATAFGNGSNQMGLDILRIHVDPNKNNWSGELRVAKAAQQRGALVFATPWTPPSSMTEPCTWNGRQTVRLKHDQYGNYVRHLNDFVAYMKNNGVNLYAISIQNEPDWSAEWCSWTADEIYNFTKYYAKDINCRVMSAQSFSYNKSIYDKILNDSSALQNIDIIGTHFYGTQVSQMSYPLLRQKASNKELWMTEVYVPDSNLDADLWPKSI
jgi:glucuronoarabinoxylan endo-1,4-beta-xylanase